MKQFVATSLLLGYIMLVPFCFFGGAAMANMDTMDMIGQSTAQMNDCAMPMSGCTNTFSGGVMGFIEHHVGMYLSISQTPLVTLLSIVVVVLALVFTVFLVLHRLIETLLSRHLLRAIGRISENPRNNSRQVLLRWLSLFETSPNFA